MVKELKNRIRENKYLTRNETDFIIKALEENSSLHEQVNMWQLEHAKSVLELGKLREGIKLTREEIKEHSWSEIIDNADVFMGKEKINLVRLDVVLEILDKLIESEDK